MGLFDKLGGQANAGGQGQNQLPDPFGSMQGMTNQWQQFAANYKGNPQQELQQLIQTGKINQAQLNMLQGIARRVAPFLGKR